MKKYIFVAIIVYLAVFSTASAQSVSASQDFMVSWKSANYVPEWYSGKSLPIAGSSVQINFELINSGKPADLSQNAVRWYVNEDLARNESDGLGIKSLTVAVPQNSGGEMTIRVSIADYDEDSVLEKTIVIPVSKPEAVINSPYSGNKIGSGLSSFELIPFFFNVDSLNELSFEWLANEASSQPFEYDLRKLDLNIDSQALSGFEVKLGAIVRSQLNQFESANSAIMLQKK
jgi:hypothetical protein